MVEPLYKVSSDYLHACDELLSIDNLPPEAIRDTIEGLQGAVKDKAVNVAAYIKNLEAESSIIKIAEDDMKLRRSSIDKKSDNLRKYLLFYLRECDISEITDHPYFAIKVRNSRKSVVIDDAEFVPDKFKAIDMIEKIDKLQIYKSLQSGEDVPGVHLEGNQTLLIK